MAPAGQTHEHRVHSGRQKPRSKFISGCINRSGSLDGRSTPLGHFDMQSWQPTQRCSRFFTLCEPGGDGVTWRAGVIRSSSTVKPPSTFFNFAIAASAPTMAAPTIMARRVVSVGAGAVSGAFAFGVAWA